MAHEIKIDSITRDKNGKILVIGVNGIGITDTKEIQKFVQEKEAHVLTALSVKKEVTHVR